MMFHKHKKDHIERLLAQAQPPRRASFEAELRTRLMHGVSHDSPTHSRLFMKTHLPFRFAFPIGALAAVLLGVLVFVQPWDRTNAAVADSIANTFSIGQEDTVRYLRMKEEIADATGQTLHSAVTEYWLAGAQSRVDITQERDGEETLFSTLSFVGADSRITNCEYTNDSLLSSPLLPLASSTEERSACAEKKDILPFNHEDVHEYRDIQPVVTLPRTEETGNIVFVQWHTDELITQNIHGYAYPLGGDARKDAFAEYTYYVNHVYPDGRPVSWDYQEQFYNRKTATGYVHSAYFPELNGYIPGEELPERVQFQIRDDVGYSLVYQYEVATGAVTIVNARELEEQADLYRAGVVYDMVAANPTVGDGASRAEMYTEVLEQGSLVEKIVEGDGDQRLVSVRYAVRPNEYMLSQIAFTFAEQTHELRRVVEHNQSGEKRTILFEENTELSGVDPATFFSQEQWEASH
jgi:hypothetical protein